MRGYREGKEAPGLPYSLTAAPQWLFLTNNESVFIGQAGAAKIYSCLSYFLSPKMYYLIY